MAKAHCNKHKRFVHNCPGCQSEALKETVGFPRQEEAEETPPGPTYEAESESPEPAPEEEDEDEEGGDIAEWEPEVEDSPPEPAPLPSYKPAGEVLPPVAGDEPDIDETEEAMAAEGEFDPDGNLQSISLVPGKGEPEQGPTQMEPIDVAMMLFPRRLIPEGAVEVCDEERPDEPYMASYEELIRRAVASYLEVGLTPEDAVIVVGAEAIKAEQYDPTTEEEQDEADQEAFDAGLEAAPELTGCIEDYNNGFNTGMQTLLDILRGYYAGDEDAVAYGTMLWLEAQMAGMKK